MIRPSGGKLKVDVRYHPRRFLRVLAGFVPYADQSFYGPWIWRIPYPKGHPKPPAPTATIGRANTQLDAINAGLAAIHRWYPPELSKYPCPDCNYEQLRLDYFNGDPRAPIWICPRCHYSAIRKETP